MRPETPPARVAIPFLAGLLLTIALIGGCARPAGVIFPPPPHPLVWPPAPQQARVRYVGQLASSADLKPPVPFGQGIGEALFGKRPVRSMLTPYAVCTDGQDRVFVADSNAQVVHVFDLAKRKYDRWKPAGKDALFDQPVGVAWDPNARRLFVADSVAGRIYVLDSAGKEVARIASAALSRPCGLAFDPRGNRLFVADAGAHRVEVLAPDGAVLATLGQRGVRLGQFNFPTNVALDRQGRLYVSDSLNFRVQQFDPELRPLRQIGRKGDRPGYFAQPKGIAVDSQDHLYVVDANFEAVEVFDADGRLLLSFGAEGNNPGEFWLPAGICIDPKDRLWIADSYNRRVQVFDYLAETEKTP